MEYRKLGKTNFYVSTVSLGCWTLGGPNWDNGKPVGWKDIDIKEVSEAVSFAVDNGVNHFDNADAYGNGRAERILGKILKDMSKLTDVYISTKVGWVRGSAEHPYEPQHIRHQCEQSLINLKRDYIDVYYFHHGDFGENDKYLDNAILEMQKLKREGKIRSIGLSAYSENDFLRLIPKINPDVIQCVGNILDDYFIKKDSPVSKIVKEHGLSMVTFSPLYRGLLLGKFSSKNPPVFEDGDIRKEDKRFKKEELEKFEKRLNEIKKRFGSSVEVLAGVAIQYVLHNPLVACAIPGFRNKKQVEINIKAGEFKLKDEDIDFIKQVFKE